MRDCWIREARKGWVRWSEEADMVGREHWTPLTEGANEAVGIAGQHRGAARGFSSMNPPKG